MCVSFPQNCTFCLSPGSFGITGEIKISSFLVWNIQTESISQISVSVYTGRSWSQPHGKSCTVSEGQIEFHLSIANNELNTHTAADSTSLSLRLSLLSLRSTFISFHLALSLYLHLDLILCPYFVSFSSLLQTSFFLPFCFSSSFPPWPSTFFLAPLLSVSLAFGLAVVLLAHRYKLPAGSYQSQEAALLTPGLNSGQKKKLEHTHTRIRCMSWICSVTLIWLK